MQSVQRRLLLLTRALKLIAVEMEWLGGEARKLVSCGFFAAEPLDEV